MLGKRPTLTIQLIILGHVSKEDNYALITKFELGSVSLNRSKIRTSKHIWRMDTKCPIEQPPICT